MLLSITPTFIWTIINLIVLYLFLRKLLFKPVTSFMEKRTSSIKESLNNADLKLKEADSLKLKYEDKLKSAFAEAEKIINEAREKATKQYEEILSNAKKDADSKLQKAREEIELEKAKMMKEVKKQITSLAIAAASKVIEANMDNEKNIALVNKFIDEVGAA